MRPEKQSRFLVLQRVDRDYVARRYAINYLRGRHAQPLSLKTREVAVPQQIAWVLAYIPIRLLNYQRGEDAGPERVSLARAYAARRGPLPPGIAKYGGWAQRHNLSVGYVVDGNHRVMAAVMRGDRAVRMFMPLSDYVALVRDAGRRR